MPVRHLSLGSNSIWLTLLSTPEPLLIHTYLLGLGADHSLLCALPEDQTLDILKSGLPCKGRSCIDGEIYAFETLIQEIIQHPATIRLTAPHNISRQNPRSFPRLKVDMTGAIRPLSDKGQILAVLPVCISNLSPVGCQFSALSSAWPIVSSLQLHISCRLPGFHHHSKFSASIEWVLPTKEIVIGTKFLFASQKDVANQDIVRWYTSQRAHLVNTTA